MTSVLTSDSADRHCPAVLIIDDDDSIRALSQWVIQRAGYPALTARDGPEGLALFEANREKVALVLLDLTMPRMSGAEVLAELQKCGIRVPIIVITGYGEEAVREEEKVGVKGVLQKPFTPDNLRELLDTHVKKAAQV